MPKKLMMNAIYAGTVEVDGTIHILREEQNGVSTSDTSTVLTFGLNRTHPECAEQLALALLVDCLADEMRARRLKRAMADILVSPLLLHSKWILTSEDIKGVVQAIEEMQGWLWIEDGYYLDENPSLLPDEVN